MNDLFEVKSWTCQCVLLGGSGVPMARRHQTECALLRPGPAICTGSTAQRPAFSLRRMHPLAALATLLRFSLVPRSLPAWFNRRMG